MIKTDIIKLEVSFREQQINQQYLQQRENVFCAMADFLYKNTKKETKINIPFADEL